MKKQNIIWLVVAAVALALVAAFWDKLFPRAAAAAIDTPGDAAAQPAPSIPAVATPPIVIGPNTVLNYSLSLSKGKKGPEVLHLQRLLNAGFSAGLVEDGIFGSNTAAALKSVTGRSSTNLTEFLSIYSSKKGTLKKGNSDPAAAGNTSAMSAGAAASGTSWFWDLFK